MGSFGVLTLVASVWPVIQVRGIQTHAEILPALVLEANHVLAPRRRHKSASGLPSGSVAQKQCSYGCVMWSWVPLGRGLPVFLSTRGRYTKFSSMRGPDSPQVRESAGGRYVHPG